MVVWSEGGQVTKEKVRCLVKMRTRRVRKEKMWRGTPKNRLAKEAQPDILLHAVTV